MNIIIIANGLFPEKPWVDTLLGGADRVVCCDGAIEKYLGWHSRQTLLPDHPVDVVGSTRSSTHGILNPCSRAARTILSPRPSQPVCKLISRPTLTLPVREGMVT